MPVTPRQVADLLGAMISIESVNPGLADGSGEAGMAAFIADWLADTGAEITVADVKPGRPNVVARLRGAGGGPTLCLNAHTDTVGTDGWAGDAFVPRLEGDRIYGRGASDDKLGCAAGMLVLRSLAESGRPLRGDLLLACVADAEGGSAGSEHLVARGGFDAAIVVMGRMAVHEIVVEHQGFGWVDITTRGVAAHSGQPDVGVDAIVHLAEVISRLHRHDKELFEQHPSLLNGRTVFHAGMIEGGSAYSTYPNCARVGLKVGLQPGEHLADRLAEIESIFAEVSRQEPGFSAEHEVKLQREPFVARGHETLQEMIAKAMGEEIGKQPRITGRNGWTDTALLQQAGIPTVMLGAPGGNHHVPGEWASVGETVKLCQILENVARQYLA